MSEVLPLSLAKIVERFKNASSSKLRYKQLIYYAKKLPEFPESEKLPENRVRACTSIVYLSSSLEEGKICYRGDSNAELTKGLLALLIEGLNGSTPAIITKLTPDFIYETGLTASLTPSRTNGFYKMFYAMQFLAQSQLTTNN